MSFCPENPRLCQNGQNMRDCLSWAALPLLAAGCAAPLPHFDDGKYDAKYDVGSAAAAGPAAVASTALRAQDEDYSPSGMFMSAHGDFMLKRRRFQPMASADILWQPNSDVSSEPGDFNLTQYDIDAKVPIAIDPDAYLELGGYFGARHYDTSSSFAMPSETFYDLGLYLGGGGFVNDDLLIEGSFYPGIYSDFDGTLTHSDYQWYFDALAVWRTQEDLFWKFGLTHDGIFKDVEVYPLLGVSYVINSQWRLDILLPRSAEISFTPDPESPKTIVLAEVTLDGNQYEAHSVAVSGGSATHVQEIRVGLGGIYRFNDMFSLFGRIGATVGGDYELTDGNGSYATGTLDPALYLSLGFGLDF